MVSSVFNSVFSLLASRNQQYKAFHTAVAHHVRTSSDYYYYYYYFGKIIQNKKYIYYKNQAQLQKAGQQKMIKTNVLSSYIY